MALADLSLCYMQVVTVRLPADELATFLPSILEGILLWAGDSKNKFRAKASGRLPPPWLHPGWWVVP